MEAYEVSKQFPESRLMGEFKDKGHLDDLEGRCLGYTVGLALSSIGQAMMKPNTKFTRNMSSPQEASEVCQSIISRIRQMDLKYMNASYNGATVSISYHPTKTVIIHKGELYVKA